MEWYTPLMGNDDEKGCLGEGKHKMCNIPVNFAKES